jgi:hypothetical protein
MFSMDGLLLRALANGLGFVDESNSGGVPGDAGASIWPASCRDSGIGGIWLSELDTYSVTTHPQAMKPIMSNPLCAGFRPSDYALSYRDVMGAACQYRKEFTFYYCSQEAQEIVATSYPEECSPYPLWQGGPGDCGVASNGDAWQDEKIAKGYHAAVISILN